MMFFTEELSSRADEAWEDEENARQLTAEVSRSKWIYPMDLVQRDFTADRPNQLWVADIERHEALSNRAVMKGHGRQYVAADWLKLRAA